MSDICRTLENETEAACVLLANIRDVVGDDEDAIHDMVEGETRLFDAVDVVLKRLAELETNAKALSNLVESYSNRAARFEDQAQQLRAALGVALGMAGIKKLERPGGTLSLRAVAPKVNITNEAAIPAKFWKPSNPTLNKAAVLEALKEGQAIDGAELSNGGETISIRRK